MIVDNLKCEHSTCRIFHFSISNIQYSLVSVLSGIKQVNVELEPGFQAQQKRDNGRNVYNLSSSCPSCRHVPLSEVCSCYVLQLTSKCVNLSSVSDAETEKY